MRKATLKQKLFAKEYVKNRGNKTQAVLAVYDTKSKENAFKIATKLMDTPIVQQEIQTQLNNSGLTLQWANESIKTSIDQNLELGKPSQAVAMDGLKFIYKLHNVIPANKSIGLKYERKEIINKDYEEIKRTLDNMNKLTQKLLIDTA